MVKCECGRIMRQVGRYADKSGDLRLYFRCDACQERRAFDGNGNAIEVGTHRKGEPCPRCGSGRMFAYSSNRMRGTQYLRCKSCSHGETRQVAEPVAGLKNVKPKQKSKARDALQKAITSHKSVAPSKKDQPDIGKKIQSDYGIAMQESRRNAKPAIVDHVENTARRRLEDLQEAKRLGIDHDDLF